MVFQINEYLLFLKNRNIISSALVILMGGMIKDVVHDFIDDVIMPATKGNVKVKKDLIKIYTVKILNLFVVTYLLFLLSKSLERINL